MMGFIPYGQPLPGAASLPGQGLAVSFPGVHRLGLCSLPLSTRQRGAKVRSSGINQPGFIHVSQKLPMHPSWGAASIPMGKELSVNALCKG